MPLSNLSLAPGPRRMGDRRRIERRETVEAGLLDERDHGRSDPARRVDNRHAAGDARREGDAQGGAQRPGDDAGFDDNGSGKRIDEEKAIALAAADVSFPLVLD